MEITSTVRQYRLIPNALPEAQRRQLRTYAPQLLVLLAVVLLSGALAVARGTPLLFIVALGIAWIAYVLGISVPRMRKRLARCWDTYVLEIGPDYIFRQQADTPDVRIRFSDIRGIERLPGRYLRVVGTMKHQVIGIPEGIENFSEIERVLFDLRPPQPLHRDRALRNTVLTALGFAAYLSMLWTKSPRIVVPLAILVASLLLWLFQYMQRSPNVSYRNKRISWVYLIFVVLCGLKVLSVLTVPAAH